MSNAISVAIEIQDRVTGTMNRILESVDKTTEQFNELNAVTDKTQEIIEKTNRNDLDNLKNEIEDCTDKANGLTLSFGNIAKAVAGLAFGYATKQAINYASDLQEVQNVVDVSFGEMSASVDEWARGTLNSVGLNELTAKRFAGTMGAMLKSSGLTGDAVTDMSMKITELAGDMASFYNLDGQTAFDKIRSGLSGETEPLKALGIDMSETALSAFALTQQTNKLWKDMSTAEKTQMRYAYLMQVTADAQGDFGRTSDSFANQTKLLSESWNQFTGEIASNFLPVLSKILGVLNDGVGLLRNFYEVIKNNWSYIAPIVGAIATAFAVYGGYLLAVKAKMVAVTVAQAVMNAVMNANPAMKIVSGIILLIGVLVAVCNWIAKTTGIAQSGIGIIVGAVAVLGAVIWNTIVGALDAVIQFLWSMFVEPIIIAVEWIINCFRGGFDNIGEAFTNLLSNLVSLLLSFVKVATKLLDAVFGSKMTEGLENLQAKLQKTAKNENAITLDRNIPKLGGTIEYKDAWNTGTKAGDALNKTIAGVFTNNTDEIVANATANANKANAIGTQTVNGINGLKDGVDISNENLVYLRDIAEKEAINKFTTAKIDVNMDVKNNVNSAMDLKTVAKKLLDGVTEAMYISARGV